MRVLIFDWEKAGHHEVYLQRVATALAPGADVVAATSSESAEMLDGSLDAELLDLGPSRPPSGRSRDRLRNDRRELELLERAAAECGATHAFHLFADHLLPALSVRGRSRVPLTLLLLRPRAHYPQFGARLTSCERTAGAAHELLVRRFRRRRDAHAVFSLDPVAAEGWSRRGGAPAYWLPEPWIEARPSAARDRQGLVLYGHMSPRKGVDRLVPAVSRLQAGTTVVLAGTGEPGFESELERYCETMSAAGASVERIAKLDESGAQGVLASARVAVLPYRRHVGMSRVLIEAAVAGTPVVADSFGLLGHLAEGWGLGTAVDTDDPLAFAAALDRAPVGPEVVEDLRRSAERIAGRQAFEAALARAFATS